MPQRIDPVGRGAVNGRGPGIHVDRCAHAHHLHASCARCVEACPAGALSLRATIDVDQDKCTGCQLCAVACPSGALDARSPALTELKTLIEASARRSGGVSFHCERFDVRRKAAGEAPIQVSCLGRIDEAMLLTAVAAGAETVCFYDGPCAQCAQAAGYERALAAVRQINLLLAGFQPSRCLRTLSRPLSDMSRREIAASRPGALSRRAFFSVLRRAALPVPVAPPPSFAEETRRWRSLPPASADGANISLPMKWRLLLASFRALPDVSRPFAFAGNIWADIRIGEGCNGCHMCAESCPTGALATTGQGGEVSLSFTAGHCSSCGLCVDVCPSKDLVMTPLSDPCRLMDGSAVVLARHDREAVDSLTASMADKLRKLLGTNAIY